MFFTGFPIMSYYFDCTSQVLDTPNHMPSQANQLYYHSMYRYRNTFIWVKRTTHQKIRSLIATSVLKLGNTVNKNTFSDTKKAVISTKW